MGFNISRYKNRIQREFEVEVVTPMFLGGANMNEAELRTPSLKGLLRFWWRATCGESDIRAFKESESEFFGSTENKSPFSVTMQSIDKVEPILKDLPRGKSFKVKSHRMGIIEYLAYGIRDHKKGYTRKHFPPKTKFKVSFLFSDESHEREVLRAFEALVHFGGIGAKSRNGFGSLAVKGLPKPSIVLEGPLKPYSGVTENADVLITPKTDYQKWEDALSDIGMAYKDARLSLERRHHYEKRRLIAKPIVQDKGGNNNERHAKPYYLHVGKLESGMFYGQILCLPYQYMIGHASYSEEQFLKYQEAVKTMNQKIKELIAGGTK